MTKVRLLLCTLSICRLFHPCKVSTWCTLRGETEWDMWTQWQCLGWHWFSVQESPPNLALSHLCCLSGVEPVMNYLSATLIFSLGKASHGSPGMCLQCGPLRTHHPDWWMKQMSSWLQIYKENWFLYENFTYVYLYGCTAEYSLYWQFSETEVL